MALLKFPRRKREEDVVLPTVEMCQGPSLTKVQLEEANKAMVEALNNNGPGNSKKARGKYNKSVLASSLSQSFS